MKNKSVTFLLSKMLNLTYDDARVNPNGGAIAVGHPLGASGIRVILTVMRQLERTAGRYALVSLCIGIGQGIALVLERESLFIPVGFGSFVSTAVAADRFYA